MKSRTIIVVAAIVVAVIGAGLALYLNSQPKTPEDFMRRARTVESRYAPKAAGLKAAGDAESVRKAADLTARILTEYTEVSRRFPQSKEAEEADFRVLKLREEVSTSPETRIKDMTAFLDKYSSAAQAADLRWEIAQMTHKDLRKPLDAIKLYEEFAGDFPKDARAAEAVFRIGNIYEEIREYARSVAAYKKLVADYPESKFADEAQFRIGNILAEKMEKKKEAEEEFAKVEKNFPKSRFAAAAGGQRRKLSEAAAKSEGEKYEDEYYGGVPEVDAFERAADELDSPEMQRLRDLGLDLLHQEARLILAPADHLVSATTVLHFTTTKGETTELIFQLSAPLKISALTQDGAELEQKRDGNLVTAALKTPVTAGTTATVNIAYSGKNNDTWGGDIITSSSTYLNNRNLIPNFGFGDMFSAKIAVDVPSSYTAVSQGDLRTSRTEDGRALFEYAQDKPIFFYSVLAAPYVMRESAYTSGSREIPLQIYLFEKTDSQYFDGYLTELPPILSFFESRLGEYPYSKLCIGQVNFFPGGMGTPGVIMIGPVGFEKAGAPAAFLAHEASHAWFGNTLTLDLTSGSIPWLSEGFANYMDALYHEHKSGREPFIRHMRTLAGNYYTAVSAVQDKSIAETGFGDPMYSTLAYDKGAFVLHALRGLMGDEQFFAMLREYVDANRQKVVTIDIFRRFAERAHADDLGWFFHEWLYETGIPRYKLNSAREVKSGAGQYEVHYEIEQLNRVSKMPLELELETAAGKERKRIDVKDKITSGSMASTAEPLKLIIDPDYWILKHPRTEEWEKAVTK